MTEDPTLVVASVTPQAGDVYTMAEAARLKGVSYHTVSRAVRRGKLPAQRLGKMAFINAADLQAWRPMTERAPRKYRRRTPEPNAAPALIDLASGERVELARGLALLLEVTHGATSGSSLDDFLGLFSDRLADLFKLRRVVVWRIDEARGAAVRLAGFGPPLSELPDELPLDQVAAFAAAIGAGGELAVIDLPASADGLGASLGQISSLFVAPLRVGGRPLGVVMGDRGGAPFTLTAAQLTLARGLTGLAALVLEASSLRGELARCLGATGAEAARPQA